MRTVYQRSGGAFLCLASMFLLCAAGGAAEAKGAKAVKEAKEVTGPYQLKRTLKKGEVLDPMNTVRVYKTSAATQETEFSVFVPKAYAKEKSWPLVLALPPNGLSTSQEAEKWEKAAESYGLIVVCAASGAATVFGKESFTISVETTAKLRRTLKADESVIEEILGRVFGSFNIEKSQVLFAACGTSGWTAWHCGWRHPEVFTALALRSASILPHWLGSIEAPEKIAKPWRKQPILVTWTENDLEDIRTKSSNTKDSSGQGPATLKFLREVAKCETILNKVVPGDTNGVKPEVVVEWWARDILGLKPQAAAEEKK